MAKAEEVVVKIPVLGTYSKTWPLNCPKSDKIVRETRRSGLARTNYANGLGLGLLFLLSTGDEKDLDVARGWVKEMVANHKDAEQIDRVPPWNAGYEGIGLCEYYLRTGDDVRPASHREECGLSQAQHVQRRVEPLWRGELQLRPL